MNNTISIKDWFRFIDEEYLSTYVKDGGSSVKFAVTPEELKTDLYAIVEARCKALDYEVIKLDAKYKLDAKHREMRAYMPQDIFFGLARQLDWRALARRFILRLAAAGRGFLVEGIDPKVPGVFDALAEINNISPDSVIREIRPEIENAVTRNAAMTKDFRVCMTQLCLLEFTSGDYNGQLLLDWLRGHNTRISNVRGFSIHSGINRATARYFIESALYWVRYTGCAGTVILFDNSRVTVARNPKDGWKYYTRAMTLEHYQLLREFVDRVDQLKSALLLVVTNREFLDESPVRSSRGYGIYDALRTRVMDDVRDRNRVNPLSSLIQLS